MRNEKLDDNFYDWVLLVSLIVCVPFAFLCAVAAKLWRAKRAGLLACESGPKAAFDRYQFGLASAEDRRELRQYFASLASIEDPAEDPASSPMPSFRSTWAGTAAVAAPGGVASRLAVEKETNAMGTAAVEVEMGALSSGRSNGEQ